MIDYKIKTLNNGLTVVVHQEKSSQMAAVNMLYRVGARNENPEHTGFAHLFEHLMFRGTEQIPNFDTPVQMASGENNAFTNNDYTDYYITLPKENLETALWLESDRMTGLNITPEGLEMEKRVVIEEYNQRYINQPYGEQWLCLRDMAYKVHPYRWATIGLSTDHIANATMDQVDEFYKRFYNPNNAILSIAVAYEPEYVFELVEKWFGAIPSLDIEEQIIPKEPAQTEARRMELTQKVPANSITIAFKMASRDSHGYYVSDMISDLLSSGSSARLYQSLVKELKILSSVNAYITGDVDPGLFVVTAHVLPDFSIEEAEQAIWSEITKLQSIEVKEYELEKVKNKFEANVIFGELNVMNKAMNLGFYTMLNDLPLINREVEIYRSITKEQIISQAKELFRKESSSTLIYNIEK